MLIYWLNLLRTIYLLSELCKNYVLLLHTLLQGRRDLNPQPSVLETGALPIELLPSEEHTEASRSQRWKRSV